MILRYVQRLERITWLRHHPQEVATLSNHQLVELMRKDGLFAKTTYWVDINMDKLMKEAGYGRKGL